MLAYAIATADRGLTFRSQVLNWGTTVSGVAAGASHANESEDVEGRTAPEPHRSQGARLQILATPDLLESTSCRLNVIGFSSVVLKRVYRARVQAEAYALQAGIEAGDVIRAAVADLGGQLDMTDWEATATSGMRQVWLTDCKSVEQAFTRPAQAKITDKHLRSRSLHFDRVFGEFLEE